MPREGREMAKTDVVADGMLTVEEAAGFSKLSRAELYRRMSAGDLKYVKFGKRRLIPRRALVELLSRCLVEG